MDLSEARQKLKYADFLLQSDDYTVAAAKHIFNAANIIVTVHYGLNKVSPQLVAQRLETGDPIEKEFARTFISLWNATPSKQTLQVAIQKIKKFLDILQEERLNLVEKRFEGEINGTNQPSF